MTVRLIDRHLLKAESKELLRTAAVSPLLFSALYLLLNSLLTLLNTDITLDLTALYTGAPFELPSLPSLFLIVLVGLVSLALQAGYTCYVLGVRRGEHMPYASMFDGFSFIGKIIALNFFMLFFICLWSTLFVIPGIIAVFRYSFAIYFLCEDPERGIRECVNLSKAHTTGYKWQFFLLAVSFFGWYLLLGLLTGFAALIPLVGDVASWLVDYAGSVFLLPYVNLTFAGFFLRATAPDDDPAPDRSDWTPEF